MWECVGVWECVWNDPRKQKAEGRIWSEERRNLDAKQLQFHNFTILIILILFSVFCFLFYSFFFFLFSFSFFSCSI